MTSPTLMTPGSSSKDAMREAAGFPPLPESPVTSGPSLMPQMPTKPKTIMGKTLGLLATLLLAQLTLAAFLFIRGSGFGAVQPNEPLVTFDPATLDRVTIQDGTGAQVELVKRDGQWRLPGHFDFPASASKVEGLLRDLQGLRTRLPVSTSPESFARFKVAADQFERRIDLRQGDRNVAVLYLGDSPGFKRLFARGSQGEAIFEVNYSAHQAGAKASDWTDQGLFALTSDQITGLSLNGMLLRKQPVGFGDPQSQAEDGGQNARDRVAEGGGQNTQDRIAMAEGQNTQDSKVEAASQIGQGGQERWVLVGESAAIDQAKAGDLARAAASLNYLEVLGTEVMPEYQLDNPVVRLTVQPREGSPREFLIGRLADSEDYVLKANDQPWYFKIGAWAIKALQEASKEQLLVAPTTSIAIPESAPVVIGPPKIPEPMPDPEKNPVPISDSSPSPKDYPPPAESEPPSPIRD